MTGPTGAPARFTTFLPVSSAVPSSSLVADVALLLAGAGRAVLVLDWSLGEAGVRSCLRRVPARRLPVGELAAPVREALRRTFGTPRGVDPFDGADRFDSVDPLDAVDRFDDLGDAERYGAWWRHRMHAVPGVLDVAALADPAGPGAGRASDGQLDRQIQQLAGALRVGCPYDHVLLHGPRPGAASGVELVAGVADAVVVTVAAVPDALDLAQRAATDLLTRRPYDLEMVVAAIDLGGSGTVRRGSGRELTARLLADLTRPRVIGPDVAAVTMAYGVESASGDALTVLVDADGPAGRDRRRIAELVAGGEDVPALPERLRAHFGNVLGAAADAGTYWLAYAPPDRSWADRIAGLLRDAGVPTRRYPGAGEAGPGPRDTVVAVASPRLAGDDRLLDALAGHGDTGPAVVAVVVESVPAGLLRGRRRVDLARLPPEDRRAELLGGLDLFVGHAVDRDGAVPYAGRPLRVPGRDRRFVGRDDLLERIRDAFAPIEGSGPGAPEGPLVLVGEPGVGKSGVAAEYARRFARDYSGVLWAPAQDARSARAALADLAREQGWPTPRGGSEAALDHLRSGHGGQRWLVVFDNVLSGALTDIPLNGVADVLVTTTSGYRPSSGRTIEVDRLPTAAGAAILRDEALGVPGLTDADAARVVEMVGGLPIPLMLAAACLRDAVARMQQLQVDAVVARRDAVDNLHDALVADAPPEPLPPELGRPGLGVAARILGVACAALARDDVGRLAVRLAQMCTHLSADGIDMGLVGHRAFVNRLAGSAGPAGRVLFEDEWVLDRVLAAGARFGLFTVEWAAPSSVRMHRVLQGAMRELTDPEVMLSRQADVLWALSDHAPLRPEAEPAVMAELERHLVASGAPEAAERSGLVRYLGAPDEPGSPAWNVRRWVVEQIGHVYATGEPVSWESALNMATAVERRWLERFGADDPLRCRLADRRGGLLFSLNRTEEARRVDMGVLTEVRRALGPAHPRAVHSAGAVAGDVLRLGRFDEALPEAETVWAELRDTFGEDHPLTLAKGYNLAHTRFLNGRQSEALALHRRCHAHRERVLGPTHPWYRESLRSLGFYLRETGDFEQALLGLEHALDLAGESGAPAEQLERIRVKRALAVTLRRAHRRSPRDVIEEAERQLTALHALLGPDHQEMLGALMGQAVDLASAGRAKEATALAARAVRGFSALAVGDAHPFVGVALANQALVQLAAGELDKAVATGRRAVAELGAAVDDVHPWLLAAQSGLVRALALQGRTAEARQLLGSTDELCRHYLPPGHPVAGAVADNRAAADLVGVAAAASAESWRELDIDLPPT
ncbi:FxSxx-COOH system tetratricopeptide repeat protein [Pseudonocardia lacus]|uniref:FxSxx-COOH system tetratricopeptide repeat protein n=1 Tax=Pseudonocardia lacus TaxID=2835865 RepID=UPI001BDD6DB7|nr:FxSxx-COOH system tetratricopeptide repeat protein [Pseudonocardia lacus]